MLDQKNKKKSFVGKININFLKYLKIYIKEFLVENPEGD